MRYNDRGDLKAGKDDSTLKRWANMWRWVLFVGMVAWVGAEVWLLLLVGRWIGVGWTLIWVLGSSLVGLFMMRWEGLRVLVRIHHRLQREELPTRELLDMGLILMGAFLLILPGFLTDALGLLLLIPPLRWGLGKLVLVILRAILPFSDPASHPGEVAPEVIEIQGKD